MANLGSVTATVDELNKLDGVTASTAELNKLAGFTGVVADLNYAKDLKATGVTNTEFDYLDGVTSNIQTQFTVTDVSSSFSISSPWTAWNYGSAFKFNGFVFLYLSAYTDSNPDSNRLIWTIGSSSLYPSEDTHFPTVAFQGDSASNVAILSSNGQIRLGSPLNQSASTYYMGFNGFYKL